MQLTGRKTGLPRLLRAWGQEAGKLGMVFVSQLRAWIEEIGFFRGVA